MPTLAPIYVSNDFTVAAAVNKPEFSMPFEGVNTNYLMTQDFMMFLANFSALPLNTAHPEYPAFLLVNEGPQKDMGGGVIKWTRTYALLPAPRNDFTSLAYSFIGFYGATASLAAAATFPVIGRARPTLTVACRVQYDYFLWVDSNTIKDSTGANVFTGTPGTATPDNIPVIFGQRYYTPKGTVPVPGSFIPTYPAGSLNDILFGTPVDFIYDPSDFGGFIPTIPSRTQYNTLVANQTEIVAEDSTTSRWHGNMYQRVSKYIVAR